MEMVYPVVIVKVVKWVKCRDVLDTGAGSSYRSMKLAETIEQKPHIREYRQCNMIMSPERAKVEMYEYEIKNVKETFSMRMGVSIVDRRKLLAMPNAMYKEIIRSYPHLTGVVIDDVNEKLELSIHMMIGASEFAKNKDAFQIKSREAWRTCSRAHFTRVGTHLPRAADRSK